MKRGKVFGIVLCVFSILVLAACGDDSSSPVTAPYGRDANGVAYAGAKHCLGCHAGFSWSEDVGSYPQSRHVVHSTAINGGDDPSCLECHAPVGDGNSLAGVIPAEHIPTEGLAAVTCEACHGAGGWEHGAVDTVGVREMPGDSTCTEKCHNDGQENTYPELESGPEGTCVPGGGAYDAGQVIYDTHYKATAGDWSGSGGVNVNDITGHVMDEFEGRACLNCHNPHIADGTINRQWNASKHADKTAEGAWAHYNWTHDGSGNLSDRTSCQKCKTTSGIIAYVDASRNGTAYMAPLPLNESFQPQMLLCYGCHESNKGIVRNPGAVTAEYAEASGAAALFPDVSESNLCLVCHGGRSNGQAIKDADFATEIAGKNFGSFNSHYLAAGGVLYRTIGYEFAGQDYADPNFYRHDTIGTPDSSTGGGEPVRTGGGGPCVECHMQRMQGVHNHRYSPLDLADPNDPESEPVGLLPFCGNCHNITDPAGQRYFNFEELEHEEESFEESLHLLGERLSTLSPTPIFFGESYPYFFSVAEGQNFGNAFTAWPDKDTMGAAFNLALLLHEPGAFAHNRFYTKRLIFDSVDFLDNGVMDGVITVDGGRYPLSVSWLDGDGEVEGIQRP